MLALTFYNPVLGFSRREAIRMSHCCDVRKIVAPMRILTQIEVGTLF